AVDLMIEDGPTPAVFEGFVGIPEALGGVFEFLDQQDVVEPGKGGHWLGWCCQFELSRNLRDNFAGPGVGQVEGTHPVDVGTGKALDAGKGGLNVPGQTLDDTGAPAITFLTLDDTLADGPVKQDQLAVDGQGGPGLGLADAILQIA